MEFVTPIRNAAALTIQRIWRGHKSRQWTEFVMKQEWEQIIAAAVTIQRHWRGSYQVGESTLAKSVCPELLPKKWVTEANLPGDAGGAIQNPDSLVYSIFSSHTAI